MKTEQEIKESEEKFRALFENTNDAIFIHDRGSQFIEVNQTACERLGYTREELLKLTPKDITPPGYKIDIQANIKTLHEKGKLMIEAEHITKDGNIVPIEISSRVFKFGGKNTIISVARDITERKEAEEALKNSEEKFRALFENTNDAIFIHDRGSQFIEVNQTACERLGYTREELLKLTPKDITPPGYKIDIQANIKTLHEKGKLMIEAEHITKDGNIVPIEISSRVFKFGGKNTIISVARDITERKEAEEALKNSEEKFRALFENTNDAIFIHDRGSQFIEVNQTACERLGYTREELLKLTPKDITPPGYKIDIQANIKTLHEKGKLMIEAEHITKDGNIVPIEISSRVFKFGGKNTIISVARDITERKEAEEALKNRNKEISMLFDASTAVLQYINFEKAQRMIFNSCNNLIGADAGYIAILAPSKKEQQKIFINPKSLTNEVDPDLPMLIRGMRAEVIKSKKTMYYNDFSTSDWIKFLPKGHVPLKNVLIAPLIINDEVKGLMGLTREEREFTDEESRIVTAFAELTSISLFNSQTLKSLEKSEQKYRRLSNILEQKVEDRTIKLKESEEKIQNLINNISDVLLEAEPSGILTYISPQINNLIGYQSEELIGLNFREFVHLKDLNLFNETAEKALETKKAVFIECRIKHKKGYFVPISARWSLVEINNEFKVFGLVSDNTERKKIDDMIKREIKQLKELDQLRNDLISRISHELNTPLTSILTGSQFLLDYFNDKMNNEVENVIKIIHQGGYRLKEMVDNLITAFEIETGQIRINIKREDINLIIKECVEVLVFQADKRKIIINLELPTDLIADIDKGMIKKAILNLLSNAVKNTQPNGDVYIKSVKHQNFMDIIIRDTGVGLTDKEMTTLFKKFGKIERYGKRMDVDIEGPGLGLYIASEIIKLHKGEIFVKSKGRNKGSTFTIRLFLK